MGRKAISGKPMETRIVIRLAIEEKKSIESVAERVGKTASAWCRDELLRLATEAKPAAKKPARKK